MIISKEKKIYIFSSHRHYDHYNKNIFKLAKEYGNIKYVLSEDIHPLVKKKEALDIHYIEEHEVRVLDDLRIETFHSTDEGVAFCISCEGNTIYHAGDLNWWYWEGEPKEWNDMIERDFKKEIEKLKGVTIDLAFLPLDNRLGDGAYLGIDYFMKHTDTKRVFPMHLNGSYAIIQKLKDETFTKEYRSKIEDIKEDGQQWRY